MPAARSGKGKGDWKSNTSKGGGKDSVYQRQQGKGSKKSYAEGSQSARLSAGGRKESNVKAALRERGDALDTRFGCVSVVCGWYLAAFCVW